MKGWNQHCRMIGLKDGLELTLSNDRWKKEGRIRHCRFIESFSDDRCPALLVYYFLSSVKASPKSFSNKLNHVKNNDIVSEIILVLSLSERLHIHIYNQRCITKIFFKCVFENFNTSSHKHNRNLWSFTFFTKGTHGRKEFINL